MDDFGVLVKNYGINPKGKSAPMVASKKGLKTQKNHDFVNQDPNFFSQSVSKPHSGNGSFLDDQNDDIFGFKSSQSQSSVSGDVFDSVFQIPNKSSSVGGFEFDAGAMFSGSGANSGSNSGFDGGNDDIWGFSEKGSGDNVEVGNGDLLSSDPVDDFWGKMAKLGLDQKGVERIGEKKVDSDDLIPGFERAQTSAKEKKSSVSSLDELEDFVSHKINKDVNGHGHSFTAKSVPTTTVKHQPGEPNFFDVDVSIDGVYVHKEVDLMFEAEAPDLDFFFSAHTKKKTHIPAQPTNMKTNEEPNLFSGTASSMDKKISAKNISDDFSFMFEDSQPSEVFREIEGESDERRGLRFARHQRAKERMEHALAEMNKREFKAQLEQEERHRIADAMEMEMKRWGAGKEGNLRALLSSLQQVLGPEFGWRPVSLTDLITSSQVKIAYKKAALCIHPDKVQQRGATLQQKYVAEKAFDLLKEAWNKFSTEELR